MKTGPRAASCQPFCHSCWSRQTRITDGAPGTRWQGKDPDISWEFEYVKVDNVKKGIRKSAISGTISTNREELCAPGPGTYLPSMRAVTADHRYTSFSKAARTP